MSDPNPYDNQTAPPSNGGVERGYDGAPQARAGGGGGTVLLILVGFLLFAGVAIFATVKMLGGFSISRTKSSASSSKAGAQKKSAEGEDDDPESKGEGEPKGLGELGEDDPQKSEDGGTHGNISHVTPVRLSSRSIYVLGVYKNTTSETIRRPRVKLHLLDQSGERLKSYVGYAVGGPLAPGQQTGLRVLVPNPPDYAKLRFEHRPRKSYYRGSRPELRISNTRTVRRGSIGYYAHGTIANKGEEEARWVQVQVILYGSGKKLVGVGNTYLTPRHLEAGEKAKFRILVLPARGAVVRSEFGYSAKAPRR